MLIGIPTICLQFLAKSYEYIVQKIMESITSLQIWPQVISFRLFRSETMCFSVQVK